MIVELRLLIPGRLYDGENTWPSVGPVLPSILIQTMAPSPDSPTRAYTMPIYGRRRTYLTSNSNSKYL